MTTRMVLTLALSLTLLGASFSFADGMIGDAESVRGRGGVGNYLFHRDYREPGKTDAILSKQEGRADSVISSEQSYENDPTYSAAETEIDTIDTRASSAVTPAADANQFGAILFPAGASEVPPREDDRLDSIANYLKSDPALSAQVVGFTDATGSAERNESLAEARAQSVVRQLRRRGVSESQLSWLGRGEANPTSDNGSADGRARNRRVEIQFE